MPKKSADAKIESPTNQDGRYAYEGLDRALHEKGRLAIMTSLMTHPEGLLFADLKRLTAMTDGNLSRHLDVLREAELIEMWKGYDKRRPQTLLRITRTGRQKFTEYLQELEQVIKDARVKQSEAAKAGRQPSLPGDWLPV